MRNNDDHACRPTKFGELGNADYVVAQSKEAMGLTGERDALVVVDRAKPEYIDCFPLMSRLDADAFDDDAELETLWEVLREGDRATIEALLVGVCCRMLDALPRVRRA